MRGGARMRYSNILFDFDGTLSRTNEIYAREFVKFGRMYDFDVRYEDAFLWISKYSIPYAIHQHQWGPDYREKCAVYRQMRNRSVLEEATPIEGARELLAHIARNGGRSFLFTDNNAVAYACLEKWDLKRYFSGAVFCSAEGFPLKPAPDGLLFLLRKYGLDASDCVIVGDRDADILSGDGAGVDGILLDPYDYYPDFSVKYRISRISQIIDILSK